MKDRLDYAGWNSIFIRTMASRDMLTSKTALGCDRYHRRQHNQATRGMPERLLAELKKPVCALTHISVEKPVNNGLPIPKPSGCE